MSPFIRLSDDYIDHGKLLALSDRAFRLWHEGLAYCRKHQTDGRITRTALKHFKYATRTAVSELATTQPGEGGPLWEVGAEDGWMVRNYLSRNRSKEGDDKAKAENAKRVGKWRSDRAPVTPLPTPLPSLATSAYVLDRRGESSSSDLEKETESADRAARLLDHYAQWFFEETGARLMLGVSPLAYAEASRMVALWDDDTLEKLGRIVLTTNDEWIAGTDRSFTIFAKKASWAHARLVKWEADQARA